MRAPVRNTRDVDLLIRRIDPPQPEPRSGSRVRLLPFLDVDTFIDGPQGRPSDGVHILFAGEKVRRITNNLRRTSTNRSGRPNFRWRRSRHWYT